MITEKKIIFYTLIVVFALNFGINSRAVVANAQTDPVGEYGSFYVSSNNEQTFLLKDYYQAEINDISWSLTVTIDSNSSSGLIFSLYDNLQISTISGEEEFTLEPGQTRTLIYNHGYIYHEVVCSCEASPLNFYYELSDPTKAASGNFEFLNTVYESFPPSIAESSSNGLTGFGVILTLFGILALFTLGFRRRML